ncbi:hypothetical protein K439DRAFT_1634614 [Ramaria rubella]|nr:hypothetical protein K439DRAFT_1634614 [Ramaria rubella]
MSSRRIFSFNRSNHTCRLSLRFHDDPPSYRESSQQYPQPCRDKLFATCLKMQSKSPNLVFYDCVQGAVAEYPYPMSAGRLISPAGISKYNERRKQAFECWFSLDEKYQTTTMAADYPPFEEYGATMPATLPLNAAVQNPTHGYLSCSKGTRQRSTVGYSVSNPKNLLTPPASIQMNQHYSSQVEGSRAPSSSPPALTDLLASIGHRGKGCSLTRFLSLVSPSLSVASGLISGPNGPSTSQSSGSSHNDLEKLEFCDHCFAAYPLEEFKTHTCCG